LTAEYEFRYAMDVHSLLFHRGTLYAVSTGTDELVRLEMHGTGVRSEMVVWRPIASAPRLDLHHLNSVCGAGDEILVSGFGRKTSAHWSSALDGFVYNVSRERYMVQGVRHPHSVIRAAGCDIYCESGRRAVRIGTGRRVEGLPGYTRGLAAVRDSLFVGTSAKRWPANSGSGSVHPADRCGVARVSVTSGECLSFLDLSACGAEIYDLLAVPGRHSWPTLRADLVLPPELNRTIELRSDERSAAETGRVSAGSASHHGGGRHREDEG
jgi:hypothetical protein